jgi:NDP-sugar pyrophosphorylase family protein
MLLLHPDLLDTELAPWHDPMSMKAMILAAGLGTRLLPMTKKQPKPLFPILGRPLIDILICRLRDAGFDSVIINTHHLAEMIDQFVNRQDYSIPVQTRFEPTILGTGGGIKNVEDFWDEQPFMVINGDIFTNIDLAQVYGFHLSHQYPVTMVLHDCEQFNNVSVDSNDHVTGFSHTEPLRPRGRQLAFTGIQVLDPHVLSFIPERTSYSIIDAYCEMIKAGITVRALVTRNHYWHDIGTMTGYRGATREAMARKVLKIATQDPPLVWSRLKGDGSDRSWHRVSLKGSSVILVDHGPSPEGAVCEADSFNAIGEHLYRKGVTVPHIYSYDRPSGLVALEDLGDLQLQTLVRQTGDPIKVVTHYKAVIDLLIFMGIEGAKDFDPAYTYQTAYYDRDLILEKESKYFVTAFLNGYMGLEPDFEDLKEECELLAEKALETSYIGFLHRDFQSRNILVRDEKYYVIDFQGGRLGPLQYDLASLLIDPYVELPERLQERLLTYYLSRVSDFVSVDPDDFLGAYRYCAINRNLQILGAFSFLSRVKGKTDFKTYIPRAISSLKASLHNIGRNVCPRLSEIVQRL